MFHETHASFYKETNIFHFIFLFFVFYISNLGFLRLNKYINAKIYKNQLFINEKKIRNERVKAITRIKVSWN